MKNSLNESNKVQIRIAYAYDAKAPADWSQGIVGRYDVYSEHYGSPQAIFVMDKVSADHALLDEIWAGWNNGSGQECAAFAGARARSMMIGDVVEIRFRNFVDHYRVERVGWEHVRFSVFQAEVDAYENSPQLAELQEHQRESDEFEQRGLEQAESVRDRCGYNEPEPEDRY